VAHQSLELFSALRETDPERAEEKLELAREATRMALDRTRNISAELKRLQEEELAEGLQAAFEKLADIFAPDGTAMEVSFSGDQSAVAAPVGMQVYLAMREAVRNAVRHSGCSRIAVLLVVEDEELRARGEDDGAGFDPDTAEATPSWGVGLRSMRERAESLGGTLRVDSEPGEGTRVEMRVPLDGLHP
jgi:signal transduction histidine kinase